MRDLVRQHPRFFALTTLAGFALRLLFFFRFPAITADSFLYGDIAKNWLQHGIYGLTGLNHITPTYIRLPGYPALLAAVFAIFGMEHYRAVLVLQVFIDMGSCFVIADLARRLVSARPARGAFLLAAICPFFANYAAAALTETLEIFFTALALDSAVAALEEVSTGRVRCWLGCGFMIAAAIFLRPDGGLLLVSVELYLAWVMVRRGRSKLDAAPVIRGAIIVAIVSLAPLVPWTIRNLRTMHRFEPLAPRYADDPGAFVPMGFNRWIKSWIVDYASVEEVYWAQSSNQIDVDKLPLRAFDSAAEREETAQLIDQYNKSLEINPALDGRFAGLAEQRIHDSPLRYYVWLPLLRSTDMWLRPRTELLPLDTRWWDFDEDPQWIAVLIVIGSANLLYVAAALAGLVRARSAPYLSLLLLFVILRSLFLGSLENPEPRYTLECFPVVIVVASAIFARRHEMTVDR